MESTPQPPDDGIDLDLATPGSRLGARAVDSLIGLGFGIMVSLILVQTGDIELVDNEEVVYTTLGRTVQQWVPIAVWGFYEVLLIANRGQTLGKMVTKIKVVTASGEDPPGLRTGLARWGVLAIPVILISTFGFVITFFVAIWFVVDAKRQGVHDKAASTYVVSADPLRATS